VVLALTTLRVARLVMAHNLTSQSTGKQMRKLSAGKNSLNAVMILASGSGLANLGDTNFMKRLDNNIHLAQTSCLSFFMVNSVSLVGIRNSCSQCKIAVVNTSDPPHQGANIRTYTVDAYSQITISTKGTAFEQLIGENPCE
jgi:hypothetical protein